MSVSPAFVLLSLVPVVAMAVAGCQGQETGQAYRGALVEAACGQCQLDLPGDGCELAVRIDGAAYFVDGSDIDDHGDAHAADGLCNAVRRTRVSGEIVDGRFVARSIELLPDEGSWDAVRLLLFSDVHCDLAAAARLVERSHDADLVVGAGDFAVKRQRLGETIGVLSSIACPAVLVPGNGESHDELREACRSWPSAHVLHGSGTTIDGIDFWGLGGGVPVTPFGDWSWDHTEHSAAALLADCPDGAVLVSHSPPLGAVDRTSDGKSAGSTAVRDAVSAKRPLLVVCGHIHDSAGREETLDSTPVVNAGPAGIEWELEAPGRG